MYLCISVRHNSHNMNMENSLYSYLVFYNFQIEAGDSFFKKKIKVTIFFIYCTYMSNDL